MFFFFSSRRRHTRYWRDWSSDVCSSDLPTLADPFYDKGSRYSAPYVTYSTGIGWRTDIVPADVAGMGNPSIGRASWRERVEISGGAASLKKKKNRHTYRWHTSPSLIIY